MEKITLPRILRPHLTIVNSDLYHFRFFRDTKEEKTAHLPTRTRKLRQKDPILTNTTNIYHIGNKRPFAFPFFHSSFL